MLHKVAIVTGANKGIGLAIVRSLCKQFEGHVYLTSRNVDLGKSAVKLLQKEGLCCNYHQLDIADIASITRLKDYMVNKYGGIDVLVNNAGVLYDGPDIKCELTIQINYFGTLNMCNMFLPVTKPGGRFVNVSSVDSMVALRNCGDALRRVFCNPDLSEDQLTEKMNEFVQLQASGKYLTNGYPDVPDVAYGVSKIGVTVMTRILANRLREQGRNDILLNCCCPGLVYTDMTCPEFPLTPDEGAITPVYLALLPKGATAPHGKYLTKKTIHAW